MTRILELIPIDSSLPYKSALLCDSGKVIYDGNEFMTLYSFQEFLRKQKFKYMIAEPDESVEKAD